MSRAERQVKALRLLVDHECSYEQIAHALGVSTFTVAEDLKSAYRAFTADREQTVPQARAIEVERTYRYDRQIIPILLGQIEGVKSIAQRVELQLRAHDRLLRSCARRSALLGLDAPMKIAPTDPSGDHAYGALDEEELARRAQAIAVAFTARALPAPTNGHGAQPEDDGVGLS